MAQPNSASPANQAQRLPAHISIAPKAAQPRGRRKLLGSQRCRGFSRSLALALKMEQMIQEGTAKNYSPSHSRISPESDKRHAHDVQREAKWQP
jgi:hypothetical protein